MRNNSKKPAITIMAIVLVLVAAITLVACGNNNGDNGNVASENSNSSDSSNQPQGSNLSDSYDGLFLGWGRVGEELTDVLPEYDDTGWCVLDADAFLAYVRISSQSRPWPGRGGIERLYEGQELTLVSSGAKNPTQLQFDVLRYEDNNVYVLAPSYKPEITFVGTDGQTYNLLEKATVEVYYSPEFGVFTYAEYLNLDDM